ncbi:MAG: MATE family efflux transporter [Rothia sp. (in: high G+C Gram-positive bacteria)]|nr:MATE family efflux transporter [Rothia sp. (in: high G+C Gram-positive bacteria)]
MASSRAPGTLVSAPPRSLNRQILALAVPAFGALIAEPLLVLADSAIVGHLGSTPLAGLTLGSTVVQTVVGLMIFLAYATTPAVARAFGAGDLPAAYRAARNGLWAALGLGALLAALFVVAGRSVLTALGGSGCMLTHALAYLLPSLAGLPGMLLVLAATGALRGFQDTKTPLYVATAGAAINVVLSWVLVYPVGLGVAGSAIATAAVQWGMGLVLSAKVLRGRGTHGVGLAPDLAGCVAVFKVGSWLMLRALCMRAALLATVVVATSQGTENLAAYQLTLSFFSLLAFALDALAIAAQALLGKEMGAQDVQSAAGRTAVHHLKNRLVRWSLGFGLFTALLAPAVGFSLAWVFTPDAQVQHLFTLSLIIVGVGQPIAAYVFILDGVLIGAADMRYLGLASVFTLLTYLPVLAALHFWFTGQGAAAQASLATPAYLLLWCAYALWYMGARALTLWWRARSGVWVR